MKVYAYDYITNSWVGRSLGKQEREANGEEVNVRSSSSSSSSSSLLAAATVYITKVAAFTKSHIFYQK